MELTTNQKPLKRCIDENEWNGKVSIKWLKNEHPKIIKKDPCAALRSFIFLRFAMVFAWSMQFIVIEWQVTASPKTPFQVL
jgi:hypothetical protein